MGAYLIIGAGLAGITIADQLIRSGQEVIVIDEDANPSSTNVATGMANPIVFKRLNKSWMVDVLMPSAENFYCHLEGKLKCSLLQKIQIDKWISSEDYRAFWNNRCKQKDFDATLDPVDKEFGRVKQGFMLDCHLLQVSYKKWLAEEGRLRNESFDPGKLVRNDKGCAYNGQHFDGIIYCEGAYAVNNDLWNWLPFKVAKGDWIIIKTKQPITEVIVNNVVNIIPLDENRYKLSSTFEWETTSWKPSPSAANELMEAFKELFDVSFEILDQQTGLRPSASDRRPYLGEHPRIPNQYIFNGFGSKGVLLAPYFSDHLADHILSGVPLMQEVDIKRHIKRFQAQNP